MRERGVARLVVAVRHSKRKAPLCVPRGSSPPRHHDVGLSYKDILLLSINLANGKARQYVMN